MVKSADFRNGVYARGWREADELPGWGDLRNVRGGSRREGCKPWLANGVQHARKRAQTITWKDEDDAAIDLTGATITGIIERAGVQTAITARSRSSPRPAASFPGPTAPPMSPRPARSSSSSGAGYSDSLSEISYRTKWTVLPSIGQRIAELRAGQSVDQPIGQSASPSATL